MVSRWAAREREGERVSERERKRRCQGCLTRGSERGHGSSQWWLRVRQKGVFGSRCHRRQKRDGGGGGEGTTEWGLGEIRKAEDGGRERTFHCFFLWIHTVQGGHVSHFGVEVKCVYAT